MRAIGLCVLSAALALSVAVRGDLCRAQAPMTERQQEGRFEITLRSPERKKIAVDQLVRDRDLDAGSIYRVKTGGYLGFDESIWVDRIEFRVFDIPVTEMPEYREFTKLLVDINKRIWSIKNVLQRYDGVSFRLMNICDKSKFDGLRDIDQTIAQQLSIYKRLNLLRALVVNSLNRFVRDRSCVDRHARYEEELRVYTRRLTNLCDDYDRLKRKTLATAKKLSDAREDKKEDKKP